MNKDAEDDIQTDLTEEYSRDLDDFSSITDKELLFSILFAALFISFLWWFSK